MEKKPGNPILINITVTQIGILKLEVFTTLAPYSCISIKQMMLDDPNRNYRPEYVQVNDPNSI
jgi:hypothetical protein